MRPYVRPVDGTEVQRVLHSSARSLASFLWERQGLRELGGGQAEEREESVNNLMDDSTIEELTSPIFIPSKEPLRHPINHPDINLKGWLGSRSL